VNGTIPGDQPLAGVGAAAGGLPGEHGRMPMARPGPQAPVKPNLYSDEEIAALAAYVASLGPGPAIPEPAQYDTCEPERRGSGTWRRAVPYQLLRVPQL
jgi:ubiquinol-cytochrome c reductase cytochrome c subunit